MQSIPTRCGISETFRQVNIVKKLFLGFIDVNKNADNLEKENGASFCQLWMGNLVVYILWWPRLVKQTSRCRVVAAMARRAISVTMAITNKPNQNQCQSVAAESIAICS